MSLVDCQFKIAIWLCAAAALAGAWGSVDAGELAKKTFRGTDYLVIRAKPADVQLHWKADDGSAIRTLDELTRILKAESRVVDMVMNAGIYTPALEPEGLHIEEGKELVGLNTKSGKGNFYLMPNGIFLIDEKDRARLVSTEEFSRLKAPCRLATQSGPLLLREGKLHPKFNQSSISKKIRNGVGVDKEGNVWFACVVRATDNVTNFFNFAEFFKSLGCNDALYLDGAISQMETGGGKSAQVVGFSGMLSVSREG